MKKITKNVAPKKSTTKKTNKNVVDLTMCQDMTDVFAAFGRAKAEKGLPINEVELEAIATNYVDAVISSLFTWNNTLMMDNDGNYTKLNLTVYNPEPVTKKAEKKPGFFKRIWNWITRKK